MPATAAIDEDGLTILADLGYVLGLEVDANPELFARVQASPNFKVRDLEPGAWAWGTLCGMPCTVRPDRIQLYLDHLEDDDGLDGTVIPQADPELYWTEFRAPLAAVLALAA